MQTMQLLELRGGYLYQHRPDIIPQGYLTNEELALWSAYYEIKQAKSDRK
jgi:hypothetical protein